MSTDFLTPRKLFISHLWIIARFELIRLYSTRRGLLYLITFSVIWYFILFQLIVTAAEMLHQQSTEQNVAAFGMFGFGSLVLWEVPEFAVYWRVSLFLFPILCIFLSADQTATDRERGTLRFLSLRCTRDGIFFGRFFGFMLIQCALIAATLISTILVVLWRDTSLLGASINSAFAIGLNLVFTLLPFTAMMSLLSATVRSPRQATVWAILILSLVGALLKGLENTVPDLAFLKYLLPGIQLDQMAQLAQWQMLPLAYIPLLQTLLLLIIGRSVMTWRAL